MNPAEIIREQTLTVTAAVDLINGILEPLVLNIEGEVSGFKISQGKWGFFDIKDEMSLLSCFMVLYQLPFALEDGMKIKIQATPKLRANNGRFSLTVKGLELVGEGELQKAFEELKKKLDSEELFDNKWKKPLPFFPKSIGLVTSKTGDALQDMLRIMGNQSGGLKVILAPVAVQGISAVEEITHAIQFFNSHCPVDVIIVARGGGSLEDLQAFNAEPVVRAVFASKIPIITGVGHEPDVTLIDLVADVRAATPTNAAEIVAPNFNQLSFELDQIDRHLRSNLEKSVSLKHRAVDKLLHRLHQSLSQPIRQTDSLKERLLFQLKQRERLFWTRRQETKSIAESMLKLKPKLLLRFTQRLEMINARVVSLDPLTVLNRGYSVAYNEHGAVIKSTKQVGVLETLNLRVSDGQIKTKVESLLDKLV